MFDDIPDNYKAQTADNEEEGWRYTQGDKAARRPPELLTRDHVARCINREVKAGRGSPHGGVFLDIAWIKSRVPNGAEHIKKKLPSMYHQFKQLADLDITQEPMEVGPTTHYIMGGVQGGCRYADVDGARACLRPASARPASTAPTGSAATRCPTSSCSASAPASTRRSTPRRTTPAASTSDRGRRGRAPCALEPFDSGARRRGPVPGAVRAAGHDAGARRHRPERARDAARARRPARACGRAPTRVGVGGHREYNPGWHAALDLHNLLTVSEAITRCAHRTQGEPRRSLPRRLSRQARRVRHVQPRRAQGRRRRDGNRARADSRDAGGTEADHRGDEVVAPTHATFRIWRGDASGRRVPRLPDGRVRRHGRARRRPSRPGRAGQRPGGALELQGRQVRVVLRGGQRQPAADVHDAAQSARSVEAGHGRADARVSADPRSRHRRVVELPGKEEHQEVQAAAPDAADGTWRMQQADVERVQEFRKCIECFLCQDVCHVLRDHHMFDELRRSAPHGLRGGARDASARRRGSRARSEGEARARLLQYHEVLHEGLPGRHHDYRQRASFRSRNGWSIGCTTRWRKCSGCLRGGRHV